jgi:hypothetical protein
MTNSSRNPSKTNSNVADVVFILEEIKRFAAMGLEEIRSLSQHDLASALPHPSGHGQLFCGQAAAERIEELADRYLAAHPLSGRLDPNRVIEFLGEEIVHRFLAEAKQVDEQQIVQILTAAINRAAVLCTDTVHFLPCHLSWAESPELFAIGPVRFRLGRKFFMQIDRELKEYAVERTEARSAGSTKEGEKEIRRLLLDEALHYYEGFKWVAEVEVRGCDPETSQQRARLAVSSAVDILHLLLGAHFSARMLIGGPRIAADQRARITRGTDGTLDIVISREPMAQMLEANWWEVVSAGDGAHYLSAAGESLQVTTNPDLVRPLCYRFLEALSWFGQAVREVSDAARVVKYITAIERMVVTGEDTVVKTVTNRCAALCWEADDRDFNWWQNEIGRLYPLRAGLLHGSITPFDARVTIGAHAAGKIARIALIRGLSFFHSLGLKIENLSQKQLRRSYKELVGHVLHLSSETRRSGL